MSRQAANALPRNFHLSFDTSCCLRHFPPTIGFSPFPRSLPSKVFVEIFLSLKQIRVGKGEKSWWLLLLVTKSWTVAGAALLGLHVKLPRSLSAASPKLSRLSVRSSRLVVDTWAAGMKTLKNNRINVLRPSMTYNNKWYPNCCITFRHYSLKLMDFYQL